MAGLIFGQLLVWALGAACVSALWGGADAGKRRALVLGYGYPIGTVALTLWMRALSLAGVSWGWLSVGAPLIAAFALLRWSTRRSGSQAVSLRSLLPVEVTFPGLSPRAAWLAWWTLLALIVLHLSFAGLEIVWRPLFPWDAWTHWATKTRVWYETLRMTPFVDWASWFEGGGYTDAIPGYPANLPLMQVWANITLGRWDDSLMNVPSICFAISLVLAFFAQLRLSGIPALMSLAGAYAVLSLPLLDTHVALAGYADFPLAVYVGLATVALWQWSQSRDRAQLALAAVLAIACPLTKNPGWAWIGVMLSGVIVTIFPRRGFPVIVAGIFFGIVGLALLGHTNVTIGGYQTQTFRPIWEPLRENYFQFANWHLLWFVLPALMVAGRRELLGPTLTPGTTMIVSALALLFVVFSFTSAAAFVSDYSTVNRATLHTAPLLIFYMIRLADRIVFREDRAAAYP